MSAALAFDDDLTTDHEQTLDLVRDAMWMLDQHREHLNATPADTWLPLLKEAETKLDEARKAAIEQLLKDSKHAVKMAQAQTANPWWELAKTYPEVRRVCVVDVALFAVQWAIKDLQSEGRQPIGSLKLARTRRS